jgi:hypothetical protein
MCEHRRVPITVAEGFLDYLRDHSGAVEVELRLATPDDLATTALRGARRALYQVPHPLEPSDPFISFATEVGEGTRGPEFWFDAADAAGFDGIPEALVAAMHTAVIDSGLTNGEITWPAQP